MWPLSRFPTIKFGLQAAVWLTAEARLRGGLPGDGQAEGVEKKE